ncbi:MAG: hypothetical protein ABW321_14560 [Polyangiales bacterium]
MRERALASVVVQVWLQLAGALCLSAVAVSASAQDASGVLDHCPRELVFPPDAEPYGKSYEDWVIRYQQWSIAFPATASPDYDTAPADEGQPRGVWFLPSVTGDRTVTRHMTVPAHTPLFVGALSIRSNNIECPVNTELTVDELIANAAEMWTGALEASVTIDGEVVPGLEDLQTSPYLVQTGGYAVTLADHDNQVAANGQECVPDGITISPNVSRGVFLMVKPLGPGHHTVRVVGIAGPEEDPAFVKDATYEIDVVRR